MAEQENQIPFEKRFGELCFEYAVAQVDAKNLRRGLSGRVPDERQRQMLDRPRPLSEKIYQTAIMRVLEAKQEDRRSELEILTRIMGNKTMYQSRNMAFDKTEFVTGVLLEALRTTETKNNHPLESK